MSPLKSPRHSFLLAAASISVLALSACGGGVSTSETPTEAPTSSVATSPTTSTSASASASSKPSATSASPTSTPSPAATSTVREPTVTEPTVTEEVAPPRGSVTTVTEEPQTPAPAPATESSAAATPNETSNADAQQSAACDYEHIRIAAEVAPGGGAAGSRYMNLTFTNSGSTPCSLSGYPSVNYVDAQGNQVGAAAKQAAEWTSSGAVIGAGESASATLRETRAGLYDAASCQPTQAAGYRVSIPGTSSSLVLNFPAEACSSSGTGQLSVGQIGAQAK